jgi:hypothetical protein
MNEPEGVGGFYPLEYATVDSGQKIGEMNSLGVAFLFLL